MKPATPRWWYRRKPPAPITRALLRPLSWLWASVTADKLRRAQPFDPGIPVICVGNLTLGGTGKTPVVAALLSRLRARGAEELRAFLQLVRPAGGLFRESPAERGERSSRGHR